ncbi:MAG TPA: hypothetical protein PLR25_23265, partial [Planctomycetaceae bacterium]|nr:hypothetical protein [Planctomycetaceae bacterium]
ERPALEAPAFSNNLARQEPRGPCVPRLEPRNKDINPHRVQDNSRSAPSSGLSATFDPLPGGKGTWKTFAAIVAVRKNAAPP